MNKSIYKISKYFMIIVGLWKIRLNISPTLKIIYSAYSCILQIMYFIFNLSLIIRAVQIVLKNTGDENKFGAISLAAVIWFINFRVLIYLIYGIPKMFISVIEQENDIFNSGNQEILTMYRKQCKFYTIISIYITLNTALATCAFVASHVINYSPDKNFMFELWFPFEIEPHVYAVYKFLMSQWGILFNSAVQCGMQSLIIFITSQFDILQINIRNVFTFERGKNVHCAVKKYIQKHQFLIKFVEDLNNSINSIILLEFLLDSVNLAAALLQIITAQSIIEITFSLVYFVLLLSQLFILAWSANEIYTQSFNVSNAIYESNWMDQSEPIKKTMLIMLMRAQKPLALTIGPFRPMNMEAGLMTVKGAYTYAGVMRQKYT
uniref:Odorant receptor n=1 Tax=Eucryptorrhynchus scrobiculatus TaxID=1552824 RepID=A0A8F4MWT7_EUCSC|nr:odorant receptor 7 [Eucryptorrhynchus scrobiculatus]